MSKKSQDDRDHEQVELMARAAPERREPTGVPHLDEILGVVLPRGGVVLVLGLPGSGKTTLASQVVWTAAKAGKSVLILTALSESTSKPIVHLASYCFFYRTLIGGPVQLLSLERILSQGLPAVATAVLAEARRIKADYVLLDGFRGPRNADTDAQAARQFLYEVGTTLINTLGGTTLVTSEMDPRDPAIFPEATTADVILGLHFMLLGVRQYRGIEAIKVRGARQRRACMPWCWIVTASPSIRSLRNGSSASRRWQCH